MCFQSLFQSKRVRLKLKAQKDYQTAYTQEVANPGMKGSRKINFQVRFTCYSKQRFVVVVNIFIQGGNVAILAPSFRPVSELVIVVVADSSRRPNFSPLTFMNSVVMRLSPDDDFLTLAFDGFTTTTTLLLQF